MWISLTEVMQTGRLTGLVLLAAVLLASDAGAQDSALHVPETVSISAGLFITGSDRAEREAAYRLDEAAYGHSRTREGRWYETEPPRRGVCRPPRATGGRQS